MITQSQRKTWQFIQKFIEKNNYSPTTAEIATGIGIKSRGVVYRYLKALESAGLIRLIPKHHRNIEMLSMAGPQHLRLIGHLDSGRLIENNEEERIDVLQKLLHVKHYAVRIKGQAMMDEGVHDGDIVVCEKADTACDGQMVLAIIDSKHLTLKQFFRGENNTIILKSVNHRLQAASYSSQRVAVHGVFIGLLRF